MTKEQLQQLKGLLEIFYQSDFFGLGEMDELKQIETVQQLVDGAIINSEA